MTKKKIFFNFLFFFLFIFINFFVAAFDNLLSSIQTLCTSIYCLIPPISMLLVIAAAVTYAAGQLASAEMRARATGWATAMIVGALFGFVLVALFPPILYTLYKNVNSQVTSDWCTKCSTGGSSGGSSGGDVDKSYNPSDKDTLHDPGRIGTG
ncbi:MAG: hypothetical protein QXH71_04200 [Candidatus Anstonellaceae archaeon]